MRSLTIRFLILLSLFFPTFASAQVANFAGTYSGTFSGGDSGTWTATISSTGAITATGVSSQSGPFTASGKVSSSGSLTMTAGGATSIGATFTGSINPATGTISGSWTNFSYGLSGSWSGTLTHTQTQTIGAINFSPTTLTAGGTTTVSATATSGLSVSFSSTTPSICTVSGNTVTAVAAGTCTIAADQAGNASYSPAPQVTQSITIHIPVDPIRYPLSVTNSGSGYGQVSSTPSGISCYALQPGYNYLVPPYCSQIYASGTSVTLTATPASGSTFTGWGGACTGTGICTLSINAVTNVTAAFDPVPFVAVTTGVTAGIITAPTATVTARVSPNAADAGKSVEVFVTAWVPSGSLTNAQQARVASYTTLAKPLGTTAENTYVLVQLTPSGWQPVVDGQLIPYASGVLNDQSAAISILNNTSTANLLGAQFCVGYGTSASEMTAAGRMQLIAAIPNPNDAKSNTGSCNVALPISDARVFAYAEANYLSYFAGTVTPGLYQQYDYRYYATTQNYLAVDNSGAIWVMGPAFNPSNAPVPVGPVESFRSVITVWEGTQ